MSAGRVLGYIGAVLFLLFGALFLIGSGDPQRGGGFAWILIGLVLVIIGLALAWFASRKPKVPTPENITYKVDLPGEVKLETMKCKFCGGTLTAENIKMLAGAPVVTCPYCGSTYQLTEEPKW